MKNYDVIFIGGSLMASSTAYSLLNMKPDLKILMIEKDPTYKYAATARPAGMSPKKTLRCRRKRALTSAC